MFNKNTGTVDISKQCLHYAKFKTDMLQKHLCIVCVLTAPCTVIHTHIHLHTLADYCQRGLFVFPYCSVSVILLESNKSRPSDGKGATPVPLPLTSLYVCAYVMFAHHLCFFSSISPVTSCPIVPFSANWWEGSSAQHSVRVWVSTTRGEGETTYTQSNSQSDR